jgi:hypothetical protein
VFAVKMFFKNNYSATVTQSVFRPHFVIRRNGKVLTRQTILNWVTQFRYLSAENPHKLHQKPLHSEKVTMWYSRCQNVVEFIVFKKANARCSSDQQYVMTEGFKPLHPAMCVSMRHLQRCRHGIKFKSSNCFCPTLYICPR